MKLLTGTQSPEIGCPLEAAATRLIVPSWGATAAAQDMDLITAMVIDRIGSPLPVNGGRRIDLCGWA